MKLKKFFSRSSKKKDKSTDTTDMSFSSSPEHSPRSDKENTKPESVAEMLGVEMTPKLLDLIEDLIAKLHNKPVLVTNGLNNFVKEKVPGLKGNYSDATVEAYRKAVKERGSVSITLEELRIVALDLILERNIFRELSVTPPALPPRDVPVSPMHSTPPLGYYHSPYTPSHQYGAPPSRHHTPYNPSPYGAPPAPYTPSHQYGIAPKTHVQKVTGGGGTVEERLAQARLLRQQAQEKELAHINKTLQSLESDYLEREKNITAKARRLDLIMARELPALRKKYSEASAEEFIAAVDELSPEKKEAFAIKYLPEIKALNAREKSGGHVGNLHQGTPLMVASGRY